MYAAENAAFMQWVSTELELETRQESRTNGRLPERPVCLTEVEAVALMVLALDAQHHPIRTSLTSTTVRHLIETLNRHLGGPT
jgi:hypothetical protein